MDLARVRFDVVETDQLTSDLSVILSYIDALTSVSTDHVGEMTHASEQIDIMRKDEIDLEKLGSSEGVVATFPEHEENLLKVHAVFKEPK